MVLSMGFEYDAMSEVFMINGMAGTIAFSPFGTTTQMQVIITDNSGNDITAKTAETFETEDLPGIMVLRDGAMYVNPVAFKQLCDMIL